MKIHQNTLLIAVELERQLKQPCALLGADSLLAKTLTRATEDYQKNIKMYNKVPMWCRRLNRQPSLCLLARGATEREKSFSFFSLGLRARLAVFLSCRYGISYTSFRARAERERLWVCHMKNTWNWTTNQQRREVRISPLYSAHLLCFNVAVCLLHAATIMRASERMLES